MVWVVLLAAIVLEGVLILQPSGSRAAGGQPGQHSGSCHWGRTLSTAGHPSSPTKGVPARLKFLSQGAEAHSFVASCAGGYPCFDWIHSITAA
jgi:hypothetical protein